jgi:hypothetical protein
MLGAKAGGKEAPDPADETKNVAEYPPEIPEVHEPPESHAEIEVGTPAKAELTEDVLTPQPVEEEKKAPPRKSKTPKHGKRSKAKKPVEEVKDRKKRKPKKVSDNELANFQKRKQHERPEDKTAKKS